MNLVSGPELPVFGYPVFGYPVPDSSADRYLTGGQHARARQPGGAEGMRGTGTLPITWPGSSRQCPNQGPGPDV